MRLVALLQAAEDRDRVGSRRLADKDRLEPALERSVLLDVLAVLVERRRADGTQLAPGEHRLEHVRCVDRPLCGAGAHDRVQLVDEEDDLPGGGGDLPEHGLQALLELAAVLRPREQRADVERPHALSLQALGHVAGDDPLGEPLDDRRLSDSRVADQHGVVLRPSRENLNYAADLLVATDHRVELPLLGELGQVATELLEGLVRALGVLRRHALGAAHLPQRFEQRVAWHDVQREQQVLGRDVVVLELHPLFVGPVEQARELGRERAAAGRPTPARRASGRASPRSKHARRRGRCRQGRSASAAAPGRAA